MNVALRTLDDVSVLVGGGTPSRSKQEYFGGNVPWVTPTDLPPIGTVRLLGAIAENITELGLRNSSATLVPPGTVLFSSRASIGKIAVADRECSTNQGFCNFVPKIGVIDSWYLAYHLSASTNDIAALAGKTTFKEVSRRKLRSFCIRVPSLEEQRRIVRGVTECMERIDEICALRHEALIEAQSLLPSVLNDVECRYGWSRQPIGCVLTGTRNGRSVRASSDGANGRVLTLTAVRGVNLDVDACKAVRLDQELVSKYQVHASDVFVSRSNTRELVGLSSIAAGPVPSSTIYPDLLIKLQPDTSRVVPRFLAFILRCPSVRRQIQDRATGTSQSMVKISGSRLREVMIPLPSREDQLRVLTMLDEALEVSNRILGGLRMPATESAREAVLRRAFAGEP